MKIQGCLSQILFSKLLSIVLRVKKKNPENRDTNSCGASLYGRPIAHIKAHRIKNQTKQVL